MNSTAIRQLRYLGLAEGISVLVLFGIAMPLKYVWGMPLAVRVVGLLHGVLFVLYGLAVLQAAFTRRWPLQRTLLFGAAGFIPLATFVGDRVLRREQEALEQGAAPTRAGSAAAS